MKSKKNQPLLGKSSTLCLCLVTTSLLAEVLFRCFTWRVRGPKSMLILSRARGISQKPAFVLGGFREPQGRPASSPCWRQSRSRKDPRSALDSVPAVPPALGHVALWLQPCRFLLVSG